MAGKEKGGYLTISEFSKMIGVPVNTIKSWDNSGELRAAKHSDGGHRYYLYEQVEEYNRARADRFSTGEFAKAAGVTEATVRNWDRDGKLVPDGRSVGRHRYYSAAQLTECLLFVTGVLSDHDFAEWLKRYLESDQFNMILCVSEGVASRKAQERSMKADSDRMTDLKETACALYGKYFKTGLTEEDTIALYENSLAAVLRQRLTYVKARSGRDSNTDRNEALRRRLMYYVMHFDAIDAAKKEEIMNSGVFELEDEAGEKSGEKTGED